MKPFNKTANVQNPGSALPAVQKKDGSVTLHIIDETERDTYRVAAYGYII